VFKFASYEEKLHTYLTLHVLRRCYISCYYTQQKEWCKHLHLGQVNKYIYQLNSLISNYWVPEEQKQINIYRNGCNLFYWELEVSA